jgi:hypothetical protein
MSTVPGLHGFRQKSCFRIWAFPAYLSAIERAVANPTTDWLEWIATVLRVEMAKQFVMPRPAGAVRLKPQRQPIAIRTILKPSRPVDQCSGDPLKAEFEKRAIMDFEQPIRDVNSEIGVDPDQMGVEGGMVDFGRGR